MTEAEWLVTDDWMTMLRSLVGVERSRKLRLWCIAWVRLILTDAEGRVTFHMVQSWFTPNLIHAYRHEADVGELFADGLITRNEIHENRAPTGGPHNVFHFPLGVSRLTPNRIAESLRYFVHEFKIPTALQLATLLRDIFGNPIHPVTFNPSWLTSTVLALAQGIYDDRAFDRMPILADALQDAGCDNEDVSEPLPRTTDACSRMLASGFAIGPEISRCLRRERVTDTGRGSGGRRRGRSASRSRSRCTAPCNRSAPGPCGSMFPGSPCRWCAARSGHAVRRRS